MSWDKFEKLVSLVREKVTNIILYRMKDPRIGFITVTKVDLSRDLKSLRVYFSVLGDQADRSKATKALENSRGFVRSEVAKALRTRSVPEVEFEYDESGERATRILNIISELDVGEKEPAEGTEEPLAPQDDNPKE